MICGRRADPYGNQRPEVTPAGYRFVRHEIVRKSSWSPLASDEVCAYRDGVLAAIVNRGIVLSILATSLALGSADYEWRKQALCRDTDPELFFPVGSTGQALLQLSKAKETCNQCTVRVECLQFAIDTNQDSGVWGGTSEDERRAIRRQMAARNRAASNVG